MVVVLPKFRWQSGCNIDDSRQIRLVCKMGTVATTASAASHVRLVFDSGTTSPKDALPVRSKVGEIKHPGLV